RRRGARIAARLRRPPPSPHRRRPSRRAPTARRRAPVMADVVASMPWGDCLVPPASPSPDLVAAVRRAHQGVPGWVSPFAPLPWFVRAMSEMPSEPFADLRFRDFELVALIVSRDNSCRFCYGAQRALMRILGYHLDAIDRLERDQLVDPDPSS